MVLTASFVRFLDRPGGRRVLAKLATRAARRETYADVEILYRNLWAHRVGKYYYPDGRKFSSDLKWADLSQEYVRNAEERWLRYGRPQKGDVVIDVGAGRGEDTLAFSQAVGETGRVIAIEAHPVSFEFLNCFCTLNRLTNVTAVQVAAMDKSGIVSMTDSENWEANSVVLSRRSQGTKVQGETLDQICDREAVEEISLIKMNIEGAERYALLGMQSVIRRTGTIC